MKRIGRRAAVPIVALLSLTSLCAAVLGPAAAQAGETVLYSFQGAPDGRGPWGALIVDHHGNLFGTTNLGGTGTCNDGCGTVFELSPLGNDAWGESVLYSFRGGSDGQNPQTGLIEDAKGNLYGTTAQGGDGNCTNMNFDGCGTVFMLSHEGGAWSESVLYSFQGNPNGNGNGDAASPNSLVPDQKGDLLGFSTDGGTCTGGTGRALCFGAAFELAKRHGAWHEEVIYRADASTSLPMGALLDGAGNIYSSAVFGGPDSVGAIFMLVPPSGGKGWTASTLYAFQNQSDGALPAGGLTFDPQGNLYGASGGTDSVFGNVFELTPHGAGSWTESVLISFTRWRNGNSPLSGPIIDSQGRLFGATDLGGAAGDGVAYMASQAGGAWTEKVLHSFGKDTDGSEPLGALVIGKGGAVYGTTTAGGSGGCSGGCGTVFRISP